ncbi:MAG TPA: TSUP family transporter [Polyangia bacterium]
MSATTIALLTLAAFVAGTVDAIGGGGGLITLPALLFAGLPPHAALATNKGGSVFGSASALATYWRLGQVDRPRVAVTFPLGLLGAFAGAAAVMAVSPAVLRPLVIGLLALAAALLVVRRPAERAGGLSPRRRLVAALLALVIGAYDGFFGPGTGTFLIIGFVLCGATLPSATADAKVVNFASNLASAVLFAHHGEVLWSVALPMAAGQLVGGVVGARLAVRGGATLIRTVVLVVVAALIVKLGWDVSRG